MRESTLVHILDTRLRGYDIYFGEGEICKDSDVNIRFTSHESRLPNNPLPQTNKDLACHKKS